ncbi:MAG: adenylosuccinase ade13 [Trichoglossum hirsutum]|nr:MAG: adenylosuccinase ade13 [Trichoglossum hirsutum]
MQASSLTISHRDHTNIEEPNRLVMEKAMFESAFLIAGHHSRKMGPGISIALASFGAIWQRIRDVRHLAMVKGAESHLRIRQIGSSAVVYKRNPYPSERICPLGRHQANLHENTPGTPAVQ